MKVWYNTNMYPDLFGIESGTMGLLMIVAAVAAVMEVFIYLQLRVLSQKSFIDLFILFLATIFAGIVFAMLFENVYEAIKHVINNEPQQWTWSKTFYGGLFGGVATFLIVYRFYYLRNNEPIIKKMLIIAPSAICLAHGIGRLGCFFNGCCYGIETDAWYGIQFPGHDHKVIPTQLFEMAFLLILALILGIMAFKKDFKYTMPIYLFSYGIFRFLIEFIRGDERGQLQGLSPSQYWCFAMVIVGAFLIFAYQKWIFVKKENEDAI